MRTIKFRAWDKKEKKMYYDIGISNTGVVMMWIDKSGGATFLGDGGNGLPEIMQFTGLKDKNGKEIFEGDIVKFVGENTKEQVNWDEESGGFCLSHQAGIIPKESVEVIGSIYENPELLK